jgi:hypothetical protein
VGNKCPEPPYVGPGTVAPKKKKMFSFLWFSTPLKEIVVDNDELNEIVIF